jgi:CHAT domain-containing protein
MGLAIHKVKLNFLVQLKVTVVFLFANLLNAHSESLAPPRQWQSLFQQGVTAGQSGALIESINLLNKARQSADNDANKFMISAALGATYLQAHRFQDAEQFLNEAYLELKGQDKARVANDLGNLGTALKQPARALQYYEQARQLSQQQEDIFFVASLNVARLSPKNQKANLLNVLLPDLQKLPNKSTRARLLLNFAKQSSALGDTGLRAAQQAMLQALQDAKSVGDMRTAVEALDGLAQLYEDRNLFDDAEKLNRQALKEANALPLATVQDILIRIDWRQARLLKAGGYFDDALASLKRSATHLEALRQDLPIESDEGLTSFASLFRPIYVGLADLILLRQAKGNASQRAMAVNEAIANLELSRQAELQDYLGERCSVLSATSENQTIPSGSAVLYPLVLEDRMELLIKWDAGAAYHTIKTNSATLKRLTADMADGLRSYDNDDYLSPAQQLYNLLVRPVLSELEASKTHTLVIASEGFLRPIPFAALHDGNQFLIEKFALATVTGMSMTDQTLSSTKAMSSLVVGLSEPGTVIDKLDPSKLMGVTQVAKVNLRGLNVSDSKTLIRDALRLPGVEDEMKSLGEILQGKPLVNAQFTVNSFSQQVATGNYRILHIASHGIFGGDASSSFILASDDVLSMNGLQSILRSDNLKRSPIELLTLSACETAEGNDRAPLGFSGAAIKARARSVLGTLWPVVDEAAQKVMTRFYGELVANNSGKALALRQAQTSLLKQAATNHPFYWAPFTLVGNWQ